MVDYDARTTYALVESCPWRDVPGWETAAPYVTLTFGPVDGLTVSQAVLNPPHPPNVHMCPRQSPPPPDS